MKVKTHSFKMLAIVTAAVVSLAATATAKTFVSFNGKFYFEFPDSWHQVDYRTVDYFLSQSAGEWQEADYEAAFAPLDVPRFYSREYLFLTVDTIGKPTPEQIDSVAASLAETFETTVRRGSVSDFIADLKLGEPVYDESARTMFVLSDIEEETETGPYIKKNLLVLRLYDKGVANFYFFAPDSLYRQVAPQFQQIVTSFSAENIDMAVPRESVKVGNVSDQDKARGATWLFWAPIAIIVVAMLMLFMRRRRTN